MQRLRQLDVIRGFAVLGLFIMNAPFYGLFDWGYVAPEFASVSDTFLITFNAILIDGRFRTLFCLLFGCAVGIQYQKYQSSEKINNRNRALIVIGALHGALLWAGDILLAYGAAGLLLINYLEKDGKANIQNGLILLVVMSSLLVFITAIEPTSIPSRQSVEFIDTYSATFQDSLAPWVANFKNFLAMLVLAPFLTVWYTLALMRIGLGAWQLGLFKNGLSVPALVLVTMAAFTFTAVTMLFKFSGKTVLIGMSEGLNWLASFCVACLYAHILIRLSKKHNVVTNSLVATGKLALSIYLLQSAIGIILFRVLFPEWSIQFDMIHYSVLSLVVISFCILFSVVYLRLFKQGPVEWLLASWLARA